MRRDDLLDLNDVLQHPGRKIAVEISTELPEEADLDLVAPLEGEMEVVSTGNLLLVTGTFKTRLVLECSRCTNPIEVDVEFDMDEQFPVEGTPSSFSSQDMAKVVDEEPYPLFEGNLLKVEDLLRQNLLLAIPLTADCLEATGKPCPDDAASRLKDASNEGRLEFQRLAKLLEPEDPKA
ncbi:MAG: DUF177 domain-containing protein [Methanoregulaceae archaeon]|nr:DUF177 domain-containing protein [Methanoregulaceae archaeon]